jgi:hypothetical protein
MATFAPGFTTDKYPLGRQSLSDEEKIEAFYKTYATWQLDIASKVAVMPNSGFAVLLLLNPYFEMIGRHYSGTEKGKNWGQGLLMVFHQLNTDPVLAEQVSELLFDSVRCLIAHIGLTGSKVRLNESDVPLTVVYDKSSHSIFEVIINPRLLVEHVRAHFEHYIAQLRDPQNVALRANFFKYFDSALER